VLIYAFGLACSKGSKYI